jgi:hypothetical protein
VAAAEAVLAAHHVAVATVGQGLQQHSWWTCTCNERGPIHYASPSDGRTVAAGEGDAHVAAALAAANLLADPAATDAAAARARGEALDEVERRLVCNCSQHWMAPKGGGGDPAHCPIHGGDPRRIVRAVRDNAEPATEVRDGE